MKAIQVTRNRYINENFITSFEYSPKTTRSEHYIDTEDFGLEKIRQAPVDSSLVIVLVGGERISFSGAPAEELFAKLNEAS
jgi:hypothetical protein